MNRFNINEDKTMDIKVIVFSTLALAGTSGLLWTGFTAADNEHGAHLEQHESEHEAVRELMQQGDILPLEQILEQARQHRTGRVLETELEQQRGGYIYEVEILDDNGEVWEMKFDAASGELLEQELED